jgi:hypothetical protein
MLQPAHDFFRFRQVQQRAQWVAQVVISSASSLLQSDSVEKQSKEKEILFARKRYRRGATLFSTAVSSDHNFLNRALAFRQLIFLRSVSLSRRRKT